MSRRTRRRLLLVGLLPLLLALAFTGKVAVMLVNDHRGRASWAGEDLEDARRSFAANTRLNYLEPWVAHYDEGTARYRLDQPVRAVASLDEALTTVPPEEECRVRINLALAHEAVGDAAAGAGHRATARAAWARGVTTLADGGCLAVTDPDDPGDPDDPSENGRSGAADERQAATATEVDRRLRDRLREQVADPDQQDRQDRPDRQDPDEQDRAGRRQDRLDRRNEQGQEKRERQQQRQRDREREQPPPDGDDAPPVTYEW